MEVGFIGLGRMGAGMAHRLLAAGHQVHGYDVSDSSRLAFENQGGSWAANLGSLTVALSQPRAVWMMLPPGAPTEETLSSLLPLLASGDTVVDGGNAHYADSERRAGTLAERGIHFIDVGTNSGTAGVDLGYCLTVGGAPEHVTQLSPVFDAISSGGGEGWSHVGASGAGHFVKMVHNAVSYGLMEAYAEGFAMLRAKQQFALNLPAIAQVWTHESLLDSQLLDQIAVLLAREGDLSDVEGRIDDTGAGRWAILEALALDVSAPALTEALLRRIRSREQEPYSDKLLAALRGEFGGHAVHRAIGAEPPHNSGN
ncbi:MAG TPA: decarboxylating 6-phosphogluconate dehydrogenase [Chloroflexota bacterium]|jgi:6-phosphogluconate dehydrogenase